jgi:hypothetical protein
VAQFHEPLDQATQWAMRKAMATGTRSKDDATLGNLTQA